MKYFRTLYYGKKRASKSIRGPLSVRDLLFVVITVVKQFANILQSLNPKCLYWMHMHTYTHTCDRYVLFRLFIET